MIGLTPRMRVLLTTCLVWLTLGAGCDDDGNGDTPDPPDHPVSYEYYLLGEYENNHLLPLYVDVDPTGRSAWCLSRLLGTLAQVDLDTQELVRVLPRHQSASPALRVVGDGPDLAWQLRMGTPPLLRIEAASETMRAVDAGLSGASDALRLDDDRLLVAGDLDDGGHALVVLDGQLEVDQTRQLDATPLLLAPVDGDSFGVLLHGGRVEVRDADTLELLDTCAAPFMGHSVGNTLAYLDTGDFVVTDDEAVGLVRCGGGEPLELQEGNENWDVISLGDEFVVLDRIGSDEPNWGEMRRYDAELEPADGPWETGKNSGYGGLDPQSGLVWMSSEGSSDLWAVDPDTGDVESRVPMGIHVESVTADPDNPGRVYVSGRLSDNLFWVDLTNGETVTADIPFHWPVKPQVFEGRLWVLDQLEAVLHELDLDSLAVLASHDLGLSTNEALMLSDVSAHPDRGSLFVTHGWDNVLVEVDSTDGAVINQWELGGAVLDKDESGRLEVHIGPDHVFTVRSVDGCITRVDPTQASVLDSAAPVEDLIPAETRLQYSALSDDGSLLYIGPHAIDATTLQRAASLDRSWTFAIDEVDGRWLAWRSEDVSVLLVDGEGTIDSVMPTEITPGAQAPEFDWMPWWEERLVFTEIRRAGLVSWPLKL